MDWIRAKDIPAYYPISRSYGAELVRQFEQDADPQAYIRDGRILIVRRDKFEEWWRERGRKRD